MFNLLCHKFVFVFENVTVDVQDLIDIAAVCKGATTKKQQVAVLTALLEKRHDQMSKKTADTENTKLRGAGPGGSKTVEGTGNTG